MIKKITQSFIKDAREYFAGRLCGNIMKRKYVDDELVEFPSKEKDLGCYFEYYFTLLMTGKGSLPKNGKIPQRGMYATGKQPLAEYVRAEANAKRLMDYFNKMGLRIIASGKKITRGRFEGSIDLLVECTKNVVFGDGQQSFIAGNVFVFDLKYSGLIDNRWEKMGWGGMVLPGPHVQKDYHKTQAVHYGGVVCVEYSFFYLVMSSKNEQDVLLLYVPVTNEMVEAHVSEANDLYEKFELEMRIGFEPRPELSTCEKCPLRDGCKDKHTFPHPVTVEI